MNRRERIENKIAKREEWAAKAAARSEQLSQQSFEMMSAIPMGQPILVGHYSEKRDRNYRNRAWNKLGKACKLSDLAKHHESKGSGLAAQLEHSIFSDDDDAVEAIEARIAEREAKRERMKLVNKLYKKKDAAGLEKLGLNYDSIKAGLEAAGPYWGSAPHLPYESQNLGANIRRDKQRLEQIKRQQAHREEAAAAPAGVHLEACNGGYVRIAFREKPARVILIDLKAAEFHWSAGSWYGFKGAIPASVQAMLNQEENDHGDAR